MSIEVQLNQATPPRAAPMEHRWGTRVPVDFPVVIESHGHLLAEGRLCNASISGALLSTDVQLPLLAPLTVVFRARVAGRARVLRFDANVVRCEAGAIAVEWRDMGSPPLVDALREARAEAQLWARDSVFD
jgi:hypothetical protein